MRQLTRRTEIEAPPESVWAVLADFGDLCWAPDARDTRLTSTSPSGVGCSRSVTGPTGIAVEEIVTQWDEGQSLAFEIPGGVTRVVGFLQETWSVTPAGSGTVVAVVMEYRPQLGPFGAALARMAVIPVLDKTLRNNLAGLKRHLETTQ